ncbi:MAG: MFS transporter [Limisphaerales bacterium]|jgi:DHA1 family tetracycline resistance protein-like MFS transporter|nr:MFS transporter [Verrucomicrobiota bacterium]
MPRRAIIFLIVFIDLIGFGIVLPMLPLYAERFGAKGLMIGLIVASFSIMQVIFSPFWGRLSDRIGRRPVLLISVGTGTLSYILFAIGSAQEGSMALIYILISRIFAGACGGNINVTQAYIADITPSRHRAAGMGLVGMAFSLGLICGPAIGAFSAHWGMAAPAAVAAMLSGLSFLLALFILKESLLPEHRKKVNSLKPPNRWIIWKSAMQHPQIGTLCFFLFVSTFCFACYEVTLGLLAESNLRYDTTHIGYLFAWHGLIAALIQGLLIRRWSARWGEHWLIVASFFCSALALFLIPWFHSVIPFVCAITLNSLAVSLNRPTTFGLISRYAPPERQGELLGVSQSMGGLARIVSPIICMVLFTKAVWMPFVFCGLIALATVFFVLSFARKAPAQPPLQPPPATPVPEESPSIYL